MTNFFKTQVHHVENRLYNLQPHGIGTGQCENIFSYLCRLAEAHSIRPSTLIMSHVHELTYSFRPREPRTYDFVTQAHAAFLNHGKFSKTLFDRLNVLTGRSDLSALTLYRYRFVLADTELLSVNSGRWCTQCISDQHSRGEAYEPLLWSIKDVLICPLHRSALVDSCAKEACSGNALITGNKVLGFCSRCHIWQGDSSSFICHNTIDSSDQQLWYAGQIDSLVSRTSIEDTPTKKTLAAGIHALHQRLRVLGVDKSLAAAKVAKSTFSYWMRGLTSPTIRALSHICYIANVNVSDVLEGQTERILGTVSATARTIQSNKPTRRSPIDKLRAKNELAAALNQPTYNLISVKSIAQKLNVDPKVLRNHFPEQTTALSQRFLKALSRRSEIHEKVNSGIIENAVNKLRAQNLEPTVRRVSEILPRNISLRRKLFREAYRKARYDPEGTED
jgi:hypothetical protein